MYHGVCTLQVHLVHVFFLLFMVHITLSCCSILIRHILVIFNQELPWNHGRRQIDNYKAWFIIAAMNLGDLMLTQDSEIIIFSFTINHDLRLHPNLKIWVAFSSKPGSEYRLEGQKKKKVWSGCNILWFAEQVEDICFQATLNGWMRKKDIFIMTNCGFTS